jgi:hypothetical protein
MTWWSDVPTRFSLMAGLSPPRTSFWEAVVNSARPAMGRYSWLRLGSSRSLSSACAWSVAGKSGQEEGVVGAPS